MEVEKIGEIYNGNFLSIMELLAKYDPVLEELIRKQCSVNYLSPQIQNELIQLISDNVASSIVRDIKDAPFYSVIMDTTQDVKKIDQLSQVYRYVTISTNDSGIPTQVCVNESFLGFHTITDQSAEGISDEIIHLLEEKNLSINKCRGQGYDGAATMSGIYSGVQTRIREKEANALSATNALFP